MEASREAQKAFFMLTSIFFRISSSQPATALGGSAILPGEEGSLWPRAPKCFPGPELGLAGRLCARAGAAFTGDCCVRVPLSEVSKS